MTLLPSAAGDAERRLYSAAEARLSAIPADLARDCWRAAAAPHDWLTVLAWALSAELWDADWTDHQKRAALAASAALHAEKGTPAACRRVLDQIGAVYDYTEPVDTPYTATVTIHNSASLLLADLAAVRAQLDAAKRASVHYTLAASEGMHGAVDLAAGVDAVVVAPMFTLRA